jgi:hypothetical protein
MSYKVYVDKILALMYTNTDYSFNRTVFNEQGHLIGKEIYNEFGYKGLFTIMDILFEHLKEYDNHYYLDDLRELECSFNNICDEFQS